ncbi:lipocalin family protein [Aquimarina sp. SS2-1]|uniref:lipocalin family protein n=1 Tax=Aquimarina besae TaxID=3342247 RepID=UPI00366C5BF4
MKKIILLVAVSISICLISCQSDDDAGPSNAQDPFIGSWKIAQEFENGVEVEVEPCTLLDVLTVSIDQKFSSTSYIEENGTCVLEDTFTGNWENIGDNIYKFTHDSDDGEAAETKITFSGNTMRIEVIFLEAVFVQVFTKI